MELHIYGCYNFSNYTFNLMYNLKKVKFLLHAACVAYEDSDFSLYLLAGLTCYVYTFLYTTYAYVNTPKIYTQNIPIIISYLHFLNPSFNVNKCSYIEFIIFQILGKILALCNVTTYIV